METKATLIEAHIFRTNGSELEFLILKRAEDENYAGIWQMVTGSIDNNEKAFEAALREIKEETGLLPQKLWVVPNVNSFYSPDKDSVIMIPVFAALVQNDSNVKISSEHSEYKWVNKEEAKQLLACNGQRKSVDTIYQYFTSEKSSLYFNELKIH
ncbi:MAG: NUDIX pyrophosphatase [Ignavibacteria bacterium]|nr:NUDIX pyrophosphatase [Ignavibacteria bacterium]